MAWSPAAWARWTCTLDPRSLACFRVAIGVVVLADALLRTRDAGLMLAPDGMFPLAELREFFGDRWAWSLAFVVDATWWGWAVLGLQGFAGAALAVGLCTRSATIAAWMAVVSIVRRTAPAVNAGDEWLCCLLFWGIFLPLGATWSVDAARRRGPPLAGRSPLCSIASAALVLQIGGIYFGAGLSKLNSAWVSGAAVATALSVHDHGSAWGQSLADFPIACRLLTWGVVALELCGPCLLVVAGWPAVRLALVALFIGFHVAIATLMSVGLFAYVGMAAWLALLPSAVWDSRWDATAAPGAVAGPAPCASRSRGRAVAEAVVAMALGIAALSFLHENTAWRARPAPVWLAAAARAACLGQDWGMFGVVRPQRQWVYGRGELADGRLVDVLRGGRPLETWLPAGGFTSLPHHRWHKLFWELPDPRRRVFAQPVAAAIARDWNRRHGPAQQLRTLEIRAARLGPAPVQETLHEILLASWPPRDGRGGGNLDRWLGSQPGD